MRYQEHNGKYIVRIMPGEELVETLTQFCQAKNITGGSIIGLGGTTDITLHYFNVKTQQYQERVFSGELYEVTNLTGNITAEKLHIHITIADSTFTAYAGHCGRAIADPTLEVSIIPFPEVHRAHDEYSGLQLLDLPESTEQV